jgi:hypothetical protein
MEYITVVIKYEDGSELPSFYSGMEVLGGQVTAVQFSDALAELRQLEEQNAL